MSTAAIKQARSLDELVRLVARTFYTDEHIVVLDALVEHRKYIKEEELAKYLQLHHRHVSKILSTLQKNQLVRSETKEERKDKGPNGEELKNVRSTHHTFWYIDYRHFVDVVKWKMSKLTDTLSLAPKKDAVQMYSCPNCNRKWDELSINELLNPQTAAFECTYCHVEVVESIPQETIKSSIQKQTLLQQLQPITAKLKEISDKDIPFFDRRPLNAFLSGQTRKVGGGGGGPGSHAHGPGSHAHGGKRTRDDIDSSDLEIQVLFREFVFGPDGKEADTKEENQHRVKPAIPWMKKAPEIRIDPEEEALLKAKKQKVKIDPQEEYQSKWNKSFYTELQHQVEFLEKQERSARQEDSMEGDNIDDNHENNNYNNHDGMRTSLHYLYDYGSDELVQVNGQAVPFNNIDTHHIEAMSENEYWAYFSIYKDKLSRSTKELSLKYNIPLVDPL